jgi:hypothetical protein
MTHAGHARAERDRLRSTPLRGEILHEVDPTEGLKGPFVILTAARLHPVGMTCKRRSGVKLAPLPQERRASRGKGGPMDDAIVALRRPGWLTFAAVVMFSVAGLRIISGIAYLADSNKVANLSAGLFGDHLFWWGLWDLLIAALAFYAAYSLLNGNTFGRVVGYIWATVTLIQSFLILSWAPWFGSASIALAILVIYALSATSDYSTQAT